MSRGHGVPAGHEGTGKAPAGGGGFKTDLRRWSAAVLGPLARGLWRTGVRPDHVTVLGFLLSVLAGAAFMMGAFRAGAGLAILSGVCDMLDGQLARIRGTGSRFGAFLDSTLDRLSDAAMLLGLAAFYLDLSGLLFRAGGATGTLPAAGGGAPGTAALAGAMALLGLLGSLLVSYTRARAEGLGLECRVGWFERPERLVLLIGAALFGVGPVMPWALGVLMVLSFVTAVQRMAHVYRQTRGTGRDD